MGTVSHLVCVQCGRTYNEGETETLCGECGLEGILDVEFVQPELTPETLKQHFAENRDYSLWRYRQFLPVHDEELPALSVGWTPVFRGTRLEKNLDLPPLFIKDDTRNPTASLKDRASCIAVVRAHMQDRSVVACSSTGNAATSLAGWSAYYGLKSYIFVPAAVPPGKKAQLVVFGATVFLVEGSYADAYHLSAAAIDEYGWYNRNCAINPYLVEGKKTVAWEFAEQTGWDPPECVFVPIGDGCTISGVYKGFAECHQAGLIRAIPKLIGVQAIGAAPLYQAWKNETPMEPMEAETLADSIAVGHPKNHLKALRAIRASKGEIVTVTDDEILEAMAVMARHTGVFGEPSGVAAFAGLLKKHRQGELADFNSVGTIVTGSGLKDIPSAEKITGSAHIVPPDLEALKSHITR